MSNRHVVKSFNLSRPGGTLRLVAVESYQSSGFLVQEVLESGAFSISVRNPPWLILWSKTKACFTHQNSSQDACKHPSAHSSYYMEC